MKQVITFVALIFFSLSSSAQSGTDLEFSRTINDRFEANEIIGPVPQGKIWKLVGFTATVNVSMFVNGEGAGLQNSAYQYSSANLPLFFNENDEIYFNAPLYASFIEYTVIP